MNNFAKSSQNFVSIVMPAFNESEGISEFISEIMKEFEGIELQIFVIDDCSEDSTLLELAKLSEASFPVTSIANQINQGHGPSTISALNAGLISGADFIIAVDGDGQFQGRDIRRVFNEIVISDTEVVEGARIEREDPYFRKIVSLATRILVRLKGGYWPKDANTPLRAYRSETLATLVGLLPPDCLTPNLFISTIIRKKGIPFEVCEVESIARRGSTAEGSTWKSRYKALPSKRFRKFVYQAAKGWVRFKL